ncbi:MAG: oxidoreductase, partial [Halorubrum sp.]
MTGGTSKTKVGALPETTVASPLVPVALTWLMWSLFAASVAALVARVRLGFAPELSGVLAVDGLTVLL